CQSWPRRERLLTGLIVVGFAVALMGILQELSGTKKIFWIWDASYSFPFGPFVNKNHFAGYLEIIIPLALAKAITLRQGERKALFWFMAAVMVAALFFSLSRGGVLGFSVSMLVFALLAYIFLRSRRALISMAAVFFVAVVLLGYIGSEPVVNRLATMAKITEVGDVQSRVQVWKETWNIFTEYPLVGTGLGTFSSIFPRYQGEKYKVFFTHAENDYLQTLSEVGLAGFLLLLALVALVLARLFSALRLSESSRSRTIIIAVLSSTSALAVHSFSDFNLHIPSNALALVAALALGFSLTESSKGRSNISLSRLGLASYRVLALIFALGLIFVIARESLGYFYFRRYQQLETPALKSGRDGSYNRHIALLEAAAGWSDANGQYHYLLGRHYFWLAGLPAVKEERRRELLARAARRIGKAVILEPVNGWYRQGLSWVYSALGKEKAALRQMDMALSLTPNDVGMLLDYSRWALDRYRALGDDSYLKKSAAGYRQAVAQDYRLSQEAVSNLWQARADYELVSNSLPEDYRARLIFYSFLKSAGLSREAEVEWRRVQAAAGRQALEFVADFDARGGNMDAKAEGRFLELVKLPLKDKARHRLESSLAAAFERRGNRGAARWIKERRDLIRVKGKVGYLVNDLEPDTAAVSHWGDRVGFGLDYLQRSIGLDMGRPCHLRLILLVKERPGSTTIRRDQLAIYFSDDNRSYQRYKGPLTFAEFLAFGHRQLAFFDLDMRARYVKVHYLVSDMSGSFTNSLQRMMEAYCQPEPGKDKGRLSRS
ncbi:MAG: O-antigen ligase family protein, partial [Dehalococcoidales bacterium]